MDVVIVSQSFRHAALITPGAGLISAGPCDGVIVSVAGNLSVELAEDIGSPVTIAVNANQVYMLACSKITALTGGGTVTALWQKVPAANQG